MQSVKISSLKGLIKSGDYVGNSLELKQVKEVTEEGFSCFNDNNHISTFHNSIYTITWISQESMMVALGLSLQSYGKHCINKASKENE